MEISKTQALGADIQFGRLCTVSFINFDSGLVTEIDQNFRITFEYNKSVDEASNTSNGQLTIYGLSESTFNKIGDRLRCEVSISCGYRMSKSNPLKEIIYAALMNKSFEISNGETVSTFELQENFMTLNVGEKISKSYQKDIKLVSVIADIASFLNLEGYGFVLGKDINSLAISDFIGSITLPYGYSAFGTPSQELKRLCDAYGFTYRIDNKVLVLSVKDHFFQKYVSIIEETKSVVQQALDKKASDIKEGKINLIDTHSYYLSYETGLIGAPKLETVHADVAYDQALRDGEEIVERKEQKVRRYKSGEKKGQIIVDKKTGKASKTKLPKMMKIARRQVTVMMLINSFVVPQAMIRLASQSGVLDGLYRVRNMRIIGDTEGRDWTMTLELNM